LIASARNEWQHAWLISVEGFALEKLKVLVSPSEIDCGVKLVGARDNDSKLQSMCRQ